MNPKRPPRQLGNYEVGYGRAPAGTRFKPGNCCNPRGRPKRKKTVGELLEEAMNTRIKITVEGRPKVMTKQQVIIHSLVNAAARADYKAIQTLFSLQARFQDSPETTINPIELGASDRKIIKDFLASSALGPGTPARAPDDATSTAPEGDETGTHPNSLNDEGTSGS